MKRLDVIQKSLAAHPLLKGTPADQIERLAQTILEDLQGPRREPFDRSADADIFAERLTTDGWDLPEGYDSDALADLLTTFLDRHGIPALFLPETLTRDLNELISHHEFGVQANEAVQGNPYFDEDQKARAAMAEKMHRRFISTLRTLRDQL